MSFPGLCLFDCTETVKTNTPLIMRIFQEVFVSAPCGDPSGIRTPDTLIKSQVVLGPPCYESLNLLYHGGGYPGNSITGRCGVYMCVDVGGCGIVGMAKKHL